MIHSELCERIKFDHTDTCKLHKSVYVFENKTKKILKKFEIETDLTIPAKRQELVSIKKKKCIYCGFCHSIRPKTESQRKTINLILLVS